MLRIEIEEQWQAVTIRLQGRLAGPWVTELDRCWQSTLARSTHRPVTVLLEAVTFVDGPGELLLWEMHKGGAKLMGRGPQSRHLVDQIQQRAG
jgi:hypothetical protein